MQFEITQWIEDLISLRDSYRHECEKVGHENYRMKEQLAAKDAEIARLKEDNATAWAAAASYQQHAKDRETDSLRALAVIEELQQPAQEQADHERYSMCVDQPAQIDCRLTKCIFHRDGACNNVSPAITLRPDGYSCWSIKVREDAKEQADEHPGGIKIVEGPESLVDTFLKRLGMKGPVSCTAETAQRIAEAAGMTMQEAGESLTHDEHPAKKGWVNITVPGLEWLPEKKYANSQAWIEASILEDFDVVLAAYDRYMQEGGQKQ